MCGCAGFQRPHVGAASTHLEAVPLFGGRRLLLFFMDFATCGALLAHMLQGGGDQLAVQVDLLLDPPCVCRPLPRAPRHQAREYPGRADHNVTVINFGLAEIFCRNMFRSTTGRGH
jgi:hypothetical protein